MARHEAERARLAVRGAVAIVVAVVAGTLMVMSGDGQLRADPEVVVGIPSAVGLITGEAPVRYHGVNVGRISGIDSGVESSLVRLQIEADAIDSIPATAMARVVPRTFFGDIYIQLIGDPGGVPLADGDELRIDTGPEAVALYDLYTRIVDVLDRMQPQKAQVALTALGQALEGRGDTVGRTIDRLDEAAPVLTPAMQSFLAATPEFRTVMQALDAATPDVVGTLASATGLSQLVADKRDGLADTVDAADGFASVVAGFVGEHQDDVITVLDSTGTLLVTTAANPDGLVDTLDGARSFGAAGARVFASGKFDIVAVPTFVGPLPYTSEDCPRYGDLQGVCGPASVNGGPQEQQALDVLQDRLADGSATSAPPQDSNPLAPMMLGPMLRGTEVRVR